MLYVLFIRTYGLINVVVDFWLDTYFNTDESWPMGILDIV